jgi:hypothetical protein
MKKIKILLAAICLLSVYSCKKEYACTCTNPGLKDPDISYVKMKEDDAKSYCSTQSLTYEELSGSCYLSAQ